MPHTTTSKLPRFALALITALSLAACSREDAQDLPRLGADIGETSVAGLSSGAYMAGQFQVAHSSIVKGAAIVAGGPYGCADAVYADKMPGPGATFLNLSQAINGCMLNGLAMFGIPNPKALADRTRALAAEGRIDPVATLASDRVYLYSGTNDRTVVRPIVEAAATYYTEIGIPKANITLVESVPSGHGFVTEKEGNECSKTAKPFILACGYDQAGAALSAIYDKLNPRAATATGTFHAFDQSAFTRDVPNAGLADTGYVYIPKACSGGARCRVEIVFHGCGQSVASVGDAAVRETGFTPWADTNNLIILFPQVAPGAATNPEGCWDWWGYTGRDFLTREAPQIKAVHRMLQRLAERA